MSNIKRQTSTIKRQMSNVKLQLSNEFLYKKHKKQFHIRLAIIQFDFTLPKSKNVKCETLDVRMSNFK